MKKGIVFFFIFFPILSYIAQNKEQIKDTIKTEIVTIETKYNPKISNAKKIKQYPQIELLERNQKIKLKYTTFPAPIASTFIPKEGVVKRMNNSGKERVFKNYVAAGFGNYTSPYFETYLIHNNRFDDAFGLNAKYNGSLKNIRNSSLNSSFSNFDIGAFYKKKDRYFDWGVQLNSERNLYNWYGLPNKDFSKSILNSIKEEQCYNYFELVGIVDFNNTYLDWAKIKTFYFNDGYGSGEISSKIEAKLELPLAFLTSRLNDISIKTSIEFLRGTFKNSFKNTDAISYSTTTFSVNPHYKMNYKNITFKAGLKLIGSSDAENNLKNIFVLPDLLIEKPLITNHLGIYLGLSGDLHTNTYKEFAQKNPYISPTLFITQTLEQSNLYFGFDGKINNTLSFNIKTRFITEQDKPLFLKNESKSDGTNIEQNGKILKGYEYGNSFKVYYDDLETTSVSAELAYDYSKELTFKAQGVYNMYTTRKSSEAWNLPTTKTSFSAEYKNPKWYTTSNIYYVGERKDLLYNEQSTGAFNKIQTLKSFVDINLNGGYHFNNKFSAFLKLNNILNTHYQRFANFDTQGFQVLGGMSYKFDF
jgi:hypothetical protein